jgi:hypothetical protein
MTGRGALSVLLVVVAGAAAVLSFAALRHLALLCDFAPGLAWLLPVVVDAGAAAATVVWLGTHIAPVAQRFARGLALALLGLSVAANALDHTLAALVLLPPWWVVVVISGLAPAVLGAVVHLAVLAGRPRHSPTLRVEAVVDETAEPREGLDDQAGALDSAAPVEDAADADDRVAELIAAGAGRRRLSRELGLTEYEARRLLEQTRTPTVDDRPIGGPSTGPGALS